MMRSTTVVILLLLVIQSWAQNKYVPASSSSITFSIRNFGVAVHGSFKDLIGTITYDADNPERTTFNIVVPSKSLDTGIALRDKHLREDEYFHVDKYATMYFVSTDVTVTGSTGLVKGLLTIKNVSLPVEVSCIIAPIGGGFKWEGCFDLDRRDYEVGGRSLSMGNIVNVKVSLIFSNP
jgi:polyisoprenoid-binding protein YceI